MVTIPDKILDPMRYLFGDPNSAFPKLASKDSFQYHQQKIIPVLMRLIPEDLNTIDPSNVLMRPHESGMNLAETVQYAMNNFWAGRPYKGDFNPRYIASAKHLQGMGLSFKYHKSEQRLTINMCADLAKAQFAVISAMFILDNSYVTFEKPTKLRGRGGFNLQIEQTDKRYPISSTITRTLIQEPTGLDICTESQTFHSLAELQTAIREEYTVEKIYGDNNRPKEG